MMARGRGKTYVGTWIDEEGAFHFLDEKQTNSPMNMLADLYSIMNITCQSAFAKLKYDMIQRNIKKSIRFGREFYMIECSGSYGTQVITLIEALGKSDNPVKNEKEK